MKWTEYYHINMNFLFPFICGNISKALSASSQYTVPLSAAHLNDEVFDLILENQKGS